MNIFKKILKRINNKNYTRTKGINDIHNGFDYYTYIYFLNR